MSKKKNRSYFKCPNILLRDDRLSFATRRVGAVLFAYSNAKGECKKSYEQIARLAKVSMATAASAVRALATCGYLTFSTTKRYCRQLRGVGYGRNSYTLDLSVLKQEQGYTFVKRDVFSHELTDSAFVIFLSILSFQGNNDRMWPSIRKLQKATGAACSTICAGLRLLKRLPTLIVQLVLKKNGTFAANTYRSATVSVSVGCDEDATATVDIACHPSSVIHSNTICKVLQGLRRIFSCRGVLRNLANKVITYTTIRFTRGERGSTYPARAQDVRVARTSSFSLMYPFLPPFSRTVPPSPRPARTPSARLAGRPGARKGGPVQSG